MDNKKIGKLIASLRNKLGLTQQELGDKIGVGFRAVSKWERGLNLPDIGNMNELSKILGITLDELMAGELKERDETKPKKKLSPKIKITIAIITAIVIVLSTIFIYQNNKTYVYTITGNNKKEYYVEGQLSLKGKEITIKISELGFLDSELNSTLITNYEYEVEVNGQFIFGYGYNPTTNSIEKEDSIKNFNQNFKINYKGQTNFTNEELLENNITIIIKYLDIHYEEIIKNIELNLFLIEKNKNN